MFMFTVLPTYAIGTFKLKVQKRKNIISDYSRVTGY